MTVTLLELDLTAPLLETPPQDPLSAALARRRPVLHDVVEGLRIAASDPDVAGLVAHVGGHALSLAQIQELRAAVRRFAATGKVTVAWTETFGELGPGTLPYYLASAFDEIWLQPSGDVGLTGVVAEAVFLKEALGKLGVHPQLSRRHEYKSAADTFLASQMTDAHREAASRLAASAMEHIVTGIAECRGLAPERVRALIDEAPLSASDAKDAGLVDRLAYRAEVYEHLRRRLGEVRLRFVHRYVRSKLMEPRRVLTRLAHRPVVAVVHGAGSIHLGRSSRRGLSTSIGSDTLGATLRRAARDPRVRAVVLRVDSGGGSYVASDAIRHEVRRVREAGKPLVVSMASVAASGGYFISMAADSILAQPGTLTGSIGVLGGKVVVRDLLDRLGITRDGVTEGRHAWMFSSYRAFSEEEWQRLEHWLDQVYDDFTAKVAADRGLSREQVEESARGRVWTGADAQARGLVDELGGLERAVEVACARAGVSREEVDVRALPHLSLAERVRGPESTDDLAASAAVGPTTRLTSLLVTPPGSAQRPLDVLTDLLGVPRLGVLTTPVLWDLR
ncbi:signal peptide peptidase SppA [Thermasporomyces composti]|jgi:protease-4|uniref:Signal peptide peptidase A n=1 Tax=Thermasporomyces composti TaxID=696763 RepID=A0A3D9V9C2_THECX|nr:signal peptide peptidase SppA [Thermasporomyces composti]REF38117.1 signal peptide peptidase A [Thermasporomyces composti]